MLCRRTSQVNHNDASVWGFEQTIAQRRRAFVENVSFLEKEEGRRYRVVSCHREASSSMVPEKYTQSWEDWLLSGTKTPYWFILPQSTFTISHSLHGPISGEA